MTEPMTEPMKSLEPGATRNRLRQLLFPLILTAIIVVTDRISKELVSAYIARYETTRTTVSVLGQFLRFIHVRNPGIALSIGRDFSPGLRRALFIVLPILVLTALGFYYVRSDEFTRLQRWAIAGIFGGGIGNLIDRISSAEGVIDWIDFRFYGILGWERFPTFNIADASTTVCGTLLLITILFHRPTTSTPADAQEESDDQES